MAVESKLSKDNSTLVISVKGKFNFKLLNEFRHAYGGDALDVKKVIVDLRDASTIDSSALGMLLNMQRHFEGLSVDIAISNCNEDVTNVFNITHFNTLFSIE